MKQNKIAKKSGEKAPAFWWEKEKKLMGTQKPEICWWIAKDVRETAQSYNQNIPGTIMLEHASTMVKYTEPAIPYKYCWPEVPDTLCC